MCGFIKLHRAMTEWEWYDDTNTFRVFLHLLLTANYKDGKYRGLDVPTGSLVTGYPALSDRLGLSIQKIRTSISKLKSTGEITVKKTSKFSIISITNWHKYQEANSQSTVNQQSINSQSTTSKEGKKERREELRAFEGFCEVAKKVGLAVPTKLTPSREKHLAARLKEHGFEDWVKTLAIIESSNFLHGKNPRKWKLDFDWLVNPNNYVKVLENKYPNKTAPQKTLDFETVSLNGRQVPKEKLLQAIRDCDGNGAWMAEGTFGPRPGHPHCVIPNELIHQARGN